jgi:hypothetical protein
VNVAVLPTVTATFEGWVAMVGAVVGAVAPSGIGVPEEPPPPQAVNRASMNMQVVL